MVTVSAKGSALRVLSRFRSDLSPPHIEEGEAFNRRTRVSGGLNHSFIGYVFSRDPFMSTLISYQKAYLTKGTAASARFVTVGSRNQAFLLSFFQKGLRSLHKGFMNY